MKNFFLYLFPANRNKIILLCIFLAGTFFRFYGLDWDQNQHLHPDERFLTMVVSAMKIPSSFPDYLNPKVSTMNPYNLNYSFFVYGTFPLNLTRAVGELTKNTQYWNIHFVGRAISAVFDLGVVLLLYQIGKKIFEEKVGLTAAFLYSISVLPIQLSHFFAVDTFLNFFLILSFYLLVHLLTSHPHLPTRFPPLTSHFLLSTTFGVSFGFALACKISALYFLPIVSLGYLFLLLKIPFSSLSDRTEKWKVFWRTILGGFIFGVVSLIVFRLNQPQAFSTGNFLNWQPNQQFINNLKELNTYNNPDSWFPPSIQWKTTTPIIFPLKNLVFWGLGLPLGTIAILSVFYAIVQLFNCLPSVASAEEGSIVKRKILNSEFLILNSLVLLWILGLFAYPGTQFVKSMRYFFPIYPFLALLSAKFLADFTILLKGKSLKSFCVLRFAFCVIILVYPISLLSIYSHPITRVTASEWIYKNVPEGATITYEEWDDGLPLGLPGYRPVNYKVESLFMYDFDTPEKWQKINGKLEKVDYIFLTSNRAYGSTMKLPEKYPQTISYYQSLFNNTGNFRNVAEFTSYPCFPPFGEKHLFCFNDDSSEEAFTVYDHPKVLIFKKL